MVIREVVCDGGGWLDWEWVVWIGEAAWLDFFLNE